MYCTTLSNSAALYSVYYSSSLHFLSQSRSSKNALLRVLLEVYLFNNYIRNFDIIKMTQRHQKAVGGWIETRWRKEGRKGSAAQ